MTDTEKISLLNFATQYIADLWCRFFAPVHVDRVIMVNGRRVRVRVEDADNAAGNELETMNAERSTEG